MGFDIGGWRDWLLLIGVFGMIGIGIVSWLGIEVGIFEMLVGGLLVYCGIFGMVDGISFGDYFGFIRILALFNFFLITIVGVNTFYVIPFIGSYLSMIPSQSGSVGSLIVIGYVTITSIIDICFTEDMF